MNATDILANAKKHHEQTRQLSSVEVGEWRATLFFPPTLSCHESDLVRQAFEKGALAGSVELIIQAARDADGRRIFKSAHKQILMQEVDRDVVVRLADALRPCVDNILDDAGEE